MDYAVACMKVKEWQEAFDVPVDIDLQGDLLIEEVAELLEAISTKDYTVESMAHILKELSDVVFVFIGYDLMIGGFTNDPTDVPEDVRTALGVLVGITEQLQELLPDDTAGLIIDEAFSRVCESNMSKRNDDGSVTRNEAGKVMKGPNYKLPDLTNLAEVALLLASLKAAA